MRKFMFLAIITVLCLCSTIPGQRSRFGPKFPTIEQDATSGNMLVGDGTSFLSVSIVVYENDIVFYENELVTY